jgi:hypothetical protein
MDNLAVTQSFKIGGDRAINILSSGDLFRDLGAVELKNDFGARQMPCILSYNLKPLHE